MDNYERIETTFNRIVVFFYCLLIYFLPISIALTESMAGFVIFFFAIKKALQISLGRRADGSTAGKFKLIVESLGVPHSALNKPIGIFLFVTLLAVFHSQYIKLSMIAFLGKTLEGYLLYLCFVDCFKSAAHIRNFIAVYFVSTLLMGINGLAQYITHTEFVRGTPLVGGRVSSSLRHANDFGAYLLLVLPFLLSLLLMPLSRLSFWDEWKTRKVMSGGVTFKILLGLLFVLTLICQGLTFSRGSWGGFLFSLGALAFFQKRGYVRLAIVGILFFMVFMPVMTQTRDVSFVSDNVKTQEEIDKENKKPVEEIQSLPPLQRIVEANKHIGFSGMGRTGFWNEALNVVKKHPVLGSGLNTYALMGTQFGYPHNCYLQMAAETGIVGLLSFLIMMVVLYAVGLAALPRITDVFWRAVLAGSMAGLSGFLAQSFLDTTFYSVQLGNLMWVFMGLIIAVTRLGDPAQELTKKKGSI